jgi:hypothetical protein
MADEVSKKFVVIRKKAPKQRVVEPTSVKILEAPKRIGSTEKRKARRKRRQEKWQNSHPGLRHVQFAIDIELWERFVERCCASHRPNVVFTCMIQEAVRRSEKTSDEPSNFE